MSFRYPKGGFITAFYDPLEVPNAPTSVSASAGDTQATVTFTAPADVGGSAITGYVAQSVPGGISATGSASPITVTGLSNGTAYTINVAAINSYGPGPYGTSGSVTPAAPIGLFAGGTPSSGVSNVIDYVTIASTGNATDFGDLTVGRTEVAGCSSSSRGVFVAGQNSTGSRINVIDYVTIASAGNATDFGDTLTTVYGVGACSSSTRGVIFGGNTGDPYTNVIQYITIATVGNTTDFGDMLSATYAGAACSSPTRGVYGGGNDATPARTNVIQYITIASTGNATDFGDLTGVRAFLASCSSSTRGLFAGGNNNVAPRVNVIDYITIASTGNATDFGDLSQSIEGLAGTSSSTRGIFGGGYFANPGPNYTNTIEYVTIASTGNSTDFGDLTVGRSYLAACSNAHGGL